jgi:hypothetical protein
MVLVRIYIYIYIYIYLKYFAARRIYIFLGVFKCLKMELAEGWFCKTLKCHTLQKQTYIQG